MAGYKDSPFVTGLVAMKENRGDMVLAYHPNVRSFKEALGKFIKGIPQWLRSYSDIAQKQELMCLAWIWYEKEKGKPVDVQSFYHYYLAQLAYILFKTHCFKGLNSEEDISLAIEMFTRMERGEVIMFAEKKNHEQVQIR